jgi:hypothetical protein
VSVRRYATAVSTFVVAIALALFVPISQLHTVSTLIDCCCPDPDRCKCPDHDDDRPTQPMMRPCHKTSQEFVSPVLPAFVTPRIETTAPATTVARMPSFVHPAPHPAPPPARPAAPS